MLQQQFGFQFNISYNMKHIVQINSIGTSLYTIVNLDNYIGELENHPFVINQPDMFRVSEDEIPEYVQYVSYEE